MNFDLFAKKVESEIGYRPTKIQGISNIARIMDGSIFLGGPNLEGFDGDRPYSFCSRLSFSPTTHLLFCIDFGTQSNMLLAAVKQLDAKRINNTKVLIDDSGVFISTNPDINTGGYVFSSGTDVRVEIDKFFYVTIGDTTTAESTLGWIKKRIDAKIIFLGDQQGRQPVAPAISLHKCRCLSKPFLLLAGLSGTGKTRFVRTQAAASDPTRSTPPQNYHLVSVRPDWHEPSDFLGYISRLGKEGPRFITTGFLKFAVKAWLNAAASADATGIVVKATADITPFWLCLDEMNLAPVEQFFADYLSVLETRKWENGTYSSDPLLGSSLINQLDADGKAVLWKDLGLDAGDALSNGLQAYFTSEKGGVPLPPNLIVAGTVNMDETTHGFSRKVIDRALTIDFGDFYPNDYDDFFTSTTKPKTLSFPVIAQAVNADLTGISADPGGDKSKLFLSSINAVLETTPFELAFRALNELYLSITCFNPQDDKTLFAVWDDFLMQKVLPRIEGDLAKLRTIAGEPAAKDPALPDEKIHGKGTVLHDLYRLLQKDEMLGSIWDAQDAEQRPDLLREKTAPAGGDADVIRIDCRSKKKLEWMMKRLKANHFTSFWA